MKKVLFVCTGNTCRSPMAQAYFNSVCDKENAIALSAGLFADGTQISHNAKQVLNENGIDFEHTSVQITQELMESADFIFGITHSHASQLISMFPQYAHKIYTLKQSIPDPYAQSTDVYRKCFEQIKYNVDAVCKYITGEHDK